MFHLFIKTGFCVCASADAQLDKDNAKVGLFIAAAMGTFALMAAVYCIYNKFYTKQQYLHTQLNDDTGRLTHFYSISPALVRAWFSLTHGEG